MQGIGTQAKAAIDALIRKLSTIAILTGQEEAAIRALPVFIAEIGPQHDIAREGERPEFCVLVQSGWLCRHKATSDGKRQILSLHLPGDIPDLQSLLLGQMDHSLSSIGPATVAFIRHEHLHDLHRRHPGLARIMWRETLIDAAAYREWLLGIGRRSAEEQMAHLFCEIFVRLGAVGLAGPTSCDMPLSQGDLADALGLSIVHVNRTLQALRGRSLIGLSRGVLTIRDWTGLRALSGFDPAYLHLRDDDGPADAAPTRRAFADSPAG